MKQLPGHTRRSQFRFASLYTGKRQQVLDRGGRIEQFQRRYGKSESAPRQYRRSRGDRTGLEYQIACREVMRRV